MAISPEQNVRNNEPKAYSVHWFDLFLKSRIELSPDREISISSGKKDQFQSTKTGLV
jgi:hypothetical protein